MKKLYRAEAIIVAYVLANNKADARHEALDAIQGESRNSHIVVVRRVVKGERLHDEWGPGSLVYGGDDVTMAEALEKHTGDE